MSLPENYEALITLSPPNTDEKIRIELKLYPSDVIETMDGAKALRDCTLDELKVYANQLESDVGDAYRQMTIAELLLDKPSEMSVNIDPDANAWLDKVVLLESTPAPAGIAVEEIAEAEEATSEEVASNSSANNSGIIEEADDAASQEAVVEESESEGEGDSAESRPDPIEEIAILDVAPANPLDAIKILATESVVEDRDVTGEFQGSANDRTGGVISADNRHNKRSAVHILLDEKPLRRMQAHASSSMRREVAGVMVGPIPEKQPDGRYVVHVTDMVIAKHTKMSGASVTYTPESWRQMTDEIRERYPNDTHVMVGWYHTHPGFGIFLSNMDLFIHTNFFTQVWHTAYVLDPVGHTSGFFSWDKDQNKVMPYDFEWPSWAARSW